MESVIKIALIGLGGALGAVARHLVAISPLSTVSKSFPFATFMINVSGSFLIGFLTVALSERFVIGENAKAAIIVGFLGAFTTFSAFEMEIFGLAGEKQWFIAAVYVVLSVLIGFAGVAGGVALANRI